MSTTSTTSATTTADGAPVPPPIRWFGTTWVQRGTGYWLRRAAVSTGALAATAAGALLLRLGVSGVRMSEAGPLTMLLSLAVGLCSALAGLRNWKILTEGKDALTGWMAEEKQLAGVWLVGCTGALAAYFARSLVEAPGEGLKRAAYDQETAVWHRRRASRAEREARRGGRRRS
ncbi:membrane protein [Kitasatospora saccharophila]|uniref:Membrane protein n=1 Tax=Kitasatospora saccharophila TaxID=407973 RepID=A0ABP5JUD6_9ACTN